MKRSPKKKLFRSPPGTSPIKTMRDTLAMIQATDLTLLAAHPVGKANLQRIHTMAEAKIAELREMLGVAEQIERAYAKALASNLEA
ncbi:hypothetical protein [Stenotrophomonas maltophilia group sp. Smal13]|uniref:hypothetical protein n=1 Tax=Stenotrophomonas maltophilia group sp. Smal13 TaxID=3377166 RepID=UPI0025550154|nr:hypothetical protein [Stenotrophomonas maltophilia]